MRKEEGIIGFIYFLSSVANRVVLRGVRYGFFARIVSFDAFWSFFTVGKEEIGISP